MDTRLKESEWIILQVLWQEAPLDLKSIISRVQAQNPSVSWDYKTYHSFLRILLDKGFITAQRQKQNNLYSPLITRDGALSCEAESLISRRGYFGSVSSLLVHMAQLRALAEQLAQEDAE
jgi:BlaI family transcriptional regulator, penicillinase repressor